VTGRGGGAELTRLIERSGELKRDLVDFACSPRLERSLAAAMAEAGLEEFDDADAIGIIDRFALQYRLPDGRTVVDRFVASRPDLDAADREMLLGWRDPVEGIFEIRGQDGDAIILLNLIDDLEYRTYSNMGRVAFQALPKDGFVLARLVPIRPVAGAWLVSGMMSSYRKSDAGWIAKAALELATKRHELVFRNPEKVEQGWRQMRENRAMFVEFFGGDELGGTATCCASSQPRRACRPAARSTSGASSTPLGRSPSGEGTSMISGRTHVSTDSAQLSVAQPDVETWGSAPTNNREGRTRRPGPDRSRR
jgi:hypothetical protein